MRTIDRIDLSERADARLYYFAQRGQWRGHWRAVPLQNGRNLADLRAGLLARGHCLTLAVSVE